VGERTVLIADDEPSLRVLLRAALWGENYDVVEAADGDDAWQRLLDGPPDLAILDLRMPGRGGVELARAIRAEPTLAATRVIVLTASTAPEDARAALAAGADRYLTKPFSPQALRASVQQVLGDN
jgi:two-component system phosphate regulon response regulator PhoB